MSPCAQSVHDCQHFLIVSRVILFSRRELSGVISNRLQAIAKVLEQLSTDSKAGGIGTDCVRLAGIRGMHHRCGTERMLDGFKGLLLWFSPHKGLIFLKQFIHGGGDSSKIPDKPPVKGGHAQEGTQLRNSFGRWPISNRCYFLAVYLNALSSHNVPQKLNF